MENNKVPVWEKVDFWIHDGGHVEHVHYFCQQPGYPDTIIYVYGDGGNIQEIPKEVWDKEPKYESASDALLAQKQYFEQRAREAEASLFAAIRKEEKHEI